MFSLWEFSWHLAIDVVHLSSFLPLPPPLPTAHPQKRKFIFLLLFHLGNLLFVCIFSPLDQETPNLTHRFHFHFPTNFYKEDERQEAFPWIWQLAQSTPAVPSSSKCRGPVTWHASADNDLPASLAPDRLHLPCRFAPKSKTPLTCKNLDSPRPIRFL